MFAIITIKNIFCMGLIDYIKFSTLLLEKANVVVTPGVGFGEYGQGYIRMALTVSKERIQEAVERLRRIL